MTEDVRLEGYPKNRCRIKMHVLIEYSHNHQDRLSMTRNKLGWSCKVAGSNVKTKPWLQSMSPTEGM